jgi:hypothetical protein
VHHDDPFGVFRDDAHVMSDHDYGVPGAVKVDPDGYGPGVGKDQYGRPVRARGLDGRLLEPLSVPDDER